MMDKETLLKELIDSHNQVISQALKEASSYNATVIPKSVYDYTEMFLKQVHNLLKEGKF